MSVKVVFNVHTGAVCSCLVLLGAAVKIEKDRAEYAVAPKRLNLRFCLGELNEKMKLDMEKSQKKIQEQQTELNDLRGKLSSLSQIVDQQNVSVQKMKAEIR